MSKILKFYQTSSGKIPFLKWHNKLTIHIQVRIEQRINRLIFDDIEGDCKLIHNGIFELRLHFSPGYRIYFSEYGKNIILLLTGGVKSSQKNDIKKAKEYWIDFKRRNYDKKN